MSFSFRPLEIPGLLVIEPTAFEDRRGVLMELFRRSAFAGHGLPPFVQANVSWSGKGVLRGLHYQRPPRAQGKLVTVLAGEVYDVAVDLRRGSPAFGRWAGVTLSEANHLMLYIPEGCAHGFCVTGDHAVVLYCLTEEYDPALDAGVRWDDPRLAVRWPVQTPILSDRDAALPPLDALGDDFVYDGRR
jgi:dTDP-4-dehydrorhamnose 3,5-epimerase